MDTETYCEVFTAMRGQIQRYAARRSSQEVAEEVTAETFAALWRGRSRAPDDADGLRAWVFGIARRQLAQAQRRDRRIQALGAHVRAALEAGVPVVGPDPATQVVEADSARRVHSGLSPRDQEILQLVCWAGLPVAQVADALGVSRSTVRTRLHRAREHLMALVRADDERVGVATAATPSRRPSSTTASAEDLAGRLGYLPRPHDDERAGCTGPSDAELIARVVPDLPDVEDLLPRQMRVEPGGKCDADHTHASGHADRNGHEEYEMS